MQFSKSKTTRQLIIEFFQYADYLVCFKSIWRA